MSHEVEEEPPNGGLTIKEFSQFRNQTRNLKTSYLTQKNIDLTKYEYDPPTEPSYELF